MEPRRRNPLRRYPKVVCISVWHFGLTHSKTRALNSPATLSSRVTCPEPPHSTQARPPGPVLPILKPVVCRATAASASRHYGRSEGLGRTPEGDIP